MVQLLFLIIRHFFIGVYLDDAWAYDFDSFQFKDLSYTISTKNPIENGPIARSNHSAVYYAPKNS